MTRNFFVLTQRSPRPLTPILWAMFYVHDTLGNITRISNKLKLDCHSLTSSSGVITGVVNLHSYSFWVEIPIDGIASATNFAEACLTLIKKLWSARILGKHVPLQSGKNCPRGGDKLLFCFKLWQQNICPGCYRIDFPFNWLIFPSKLGSSGNITLRMPFIVWLPTIQEHIMIAAVLDSSSNHTHIVIWCYL